MVGGSNPPSATNPTPLDQLADLAGRGARVSGLPDDAAIVVAVSGGSDSIALLSGMAGAVERAQRAWRLCVGHLDHGLRHDSGDDAAFVRDAAAALGLPCEVSRIDVASLARTEGRSIEDAGRQARYRFFEQMAGTDGWIVTGHTADDAAESVVLNLIRGMGLAGARGMSARRGRIVRPLLGERRATLRALLDGAGVAYRDDPSNDAPEFLRNRVRHEVLPLLEDLRAGAVDRILNFARLASDDDAILDGIAAAELARRRAPDGGIDWREPPEPALGRRIVRLAAGDPAPNAERVEALLAAAARPRGGVRIEIGGGRFAHVRARVIRFG